MKDMLPKIQNFEDFQNLKDCFFWVNLIEFDSICIDLRRSTSIHIDPHRSTLICLDLNLKISSVFRIYQDFDSLFTFHMGEVNNWPLWRQSDSVGLGNFSKKCVYSFSCYFQGLFFVLIRIFIEDFSFFLNEKLRKMLFLKKNFLADARNGGGVCALYAQSVYTNQLRKNTPKNFPRAARAARVTL